MCKLLARLGGAERQRVLGSLWGQTLILPAHSHLGAKIADSAPSRCREDNCDLNISRQHFSISQSLFNESYVYK